MSKRTVIVSGGMLEKDFALPIIKSEDTEFVIGVDRGLKFLYDHEIKPDYIVGDFDSVPKGLVDYYREEADVPIGNSIRSRMHRIRRSLCASALG